MLSGLLSGATYPFRAINIFLKKPHLIVFLLMPIFVNICVGITLYLTLFIPGWYGIADLTVFLNTWLDNLIANLPQWLDLLAYIITGFGWLLRLLLILSLLLLTGLLLLQFGTILGAPWYGQLSEKIEKLRTGELQVVEVGIMGDIGRAILFELKKIVLAILVGIGLLAINLLPVVGSVLSTIGGVALAATIVCLDFLDGPSERRRYKFRKKLAIVWGSLPASGTFSLICLGLISIPLLNLITIPICVAAGTLFWCDRVMPKL